MAMKTYIRFFVLAFLPVTFFLTSSAAHASYTLFSFSFPGITSTGNNGLTLKDFVPQKYLDGLASDVYNNSYSGAGCSGGHCGYPVSCPVNDGTCGYYNDPSFGNVIGAFHGRVDSEHSFPEDDGRYFMKGYPGQLMGSNDSFVAATAQRACQAFAMVDTGVWDPTVTATFSDPAGNGDDGSYRNNLSYYNGGWDIFEANHHYDKLQGDERNSGAAITALTCIGTQAPAQTLTINGGSTATVKAGQTANLAWADNDNFAGAKQTCTASTDNSDPNGAFTIPVPPASKTPYATCGGSGTPDLIAGKSSSDDPGETSTLMSVPTDGNGNPLYEYGCVESYPDAPPSTCVNRTHTCQEWTNDGGKRVCDLYYNTAWCPVAPPTGSVTVTSSATGTYHYHYNCIGGGKETDKTVTLVVTAGDTLPDLTASNLATVPAQPIVNQAATISATFSNSNATSTGTGFSDLFQIDPPEDTDHSNPTNIATSSPVLIAGASNSRSIIYTFNEQGTWYIRACADKDVNGNGTISESDETNNCTNGGAWTGITVKGVTVTLSCSVDTTLPVDAGTPVKLTAHPGGFTAPLTYTWTTSPGSSCGNVNPCNTTYSTAGDYTPSVTVSDTLGDQKSATCAPDVTVRPICSVNPPSGTVPITVTWTASGGSSYAWYDGADNDLNDHTSQYSNNFTVPNNYGAYVVSAGQKSTTCITNLTSCNQNPRGTLSANPTRVATGTASTLTYSNLAGIPAVSECYIVSVPSNGNPIDIGQSTDSCSLSGGSKGSGAINTQTLFKVVCGSQDVNGASTTVDVAPDINEF